MNTLTFRRASSADLSSIVALLADDELGATREDASLPLDARYTAAFDAIDADPNQLLLVAESGGAVVGCLQLTFIPGLSRTGQWRGQIESVRVARDRRGAGVGREMFAFAISECRRRGCGLVQLTTDKNRRDAHRFYADLGFVASHEGYKLAL
jgi:ribosomal protein S18 acetylase RimI-like enzyme